MNVFIYGTLKRGFALHEKGLSGARYIGDAQTLEPYPLYIAADFFGPMMLDRPGVGLHVRGELFEIDEERLSVLDALEDVGKEGSFRSELNVKPVEGSIVSSAIGFFKGDNWLNPLHSGYLADYQDRRFIPPWER